MSPSQHLARAPRVPASIVFALVLASAVGCQSAAGARQERPAPATVSDGYGEKPKGDVGGTVSSVTFDDSTVARVTRVEQLLEDRFPGVHVQRTSDGGYSVSIRGVGSFMANEQPLYVIDGVPMEVRSSRGLGWLNPADVVRIDVLRNPVETSIYGVRGANGVIVITTRRHR